MKTLQPLVTVVMNCLNGEKYLREAIQSVFSQTYENWEIVFFDNASTDSSASIAQSYGSRIRYFRNPETVPLGAARHAALEKAQGEFVCFLDVDDVWYPIKLERQIQAMSDSRFTLCYGGVDEVLEDGTPLRKALPLHPSGQIFPRLLRQFDINMVTPMIRLSALRTRNLSFDPQIHGSEEYNLFMRLAANSEFATVPEVLGKVRVRADSLTSQIMHKWADERFRTLEQIKTENPGIEEIYPKEFAEAYARGHYYHARCAHMRGDFVARRDALQRATQGGFKYRILKTIASLPGPGWNLLHSEAVRRRLSALLIR